VQITLFGLVEECFVWKHNVKVIHDLSFKIYHSLLSSCQVDFAQVASIDEEQQFFLNEVPGLRLVLKIVNLSNQISIHEFTQRLTSLEFFFLLLQINFDHKQRF